MLKEEIIPLEYWGFIRLGRAKKILEDFEGAIQEYTKAIITSKKLSNAFFHRGNIYSILGNHHLAIKDYKEALQKSSTCFMKSYILEKIQKQYLDKFNKLEN
jgi:tetratricopeptide (TPR) repeat protein